jgi:hypothetical protein
MASGYVGRVEYSHSSHAQLEIDDLDRSDWVGVPSGALLLLNRAASDAMPVGVVLLDGPRAGASALATVVVRQPNDPTAAEVRFEGRTSFGAEADPAAAREAEQHYAERQQRLGELARLSERSPGSGEAAPEFEPRDDESYGLSVLDRPRTSGDELPLHMLHDGRSVAPLREGTLRLALEHRGHQIYAAQGHDDDSLFLVHTSPGSAGAAGGPRSNITERGAMVMSSESATHRIIMGIVPDAVVAVRSHERDAVMGDNVFLLDTDHATIADLTFETDERQYSWKRQPPNS